MLLWRTFCILSTLFNLIVLFVNSISGMRQNNKFLKKQFSEKVTYITTFLSVTAKQKC